MCESRVNDVMSAEMLSVGADVRLEDVARIVARYGAVAVVDRDGVVVGVVEPADMDYERIWPRGLRGRLPRRGAAVARTRGEYARDVMRRPVPTVTPDVSALEVAHMLVRLRAGRLPVVDDERRLVGSVGATDVLRVFLRPDQELLDEITHGVLGGALAAAADAGAVRIDAADGVVTLRGRLQRRSLARDAVRLAGEVEGVVRVVDRLTFACDDTGGVPPEGNPTTGPTGTDGA